MEFVLFIHTLTLFQQNFQSIEDRTQQASDSAEFMLDFWEKMVKLEKEYARNVEELCTSRYAQLTRLFQTQSVEPVT